MSSNFEDKAKEIINDVKDDSSSFDKKDIESGKVMAILCYIGILVLIPYFAEKNNKYVVYHAKQGLNLFLLDVIAAVAVSIISGILTWRLYFLSSIISYIVGIFFFVLSIIGIVNVCNGKGK